MDDPLDYLLHVVTERAEPKEGGEIARDLIARSEGIPR